ncbi:MAG: GIY-YIG nuclease family protein [Saprospiraceae bacterium]
MSFCYILFSKKLDKFYSGATNDSVELRLEKHKTNFFGNEKFTAKADDWEVFLIIPALDFPHATRIEAHIKKMKSKVYIQNLAAYEELRSKLYKNTIKENN